MTLFAERWETRSPYRKVNPRVTRGSHLLPGVLWPYLPLHEGPHDRVASQIYIDVRNKVTAHAPFYHRYD